MKQTVTATILWKTQFAETKIITESSLSWAVSYQPVILR